MQETQGEENQPNSDIDRREQLLRQTLNEFEEDLAKRKAAVSKKRDKWTLREGYYMVVFQAFVIFCVGGIHGSNMTSAPRRNERGLLFDADGNVGFSIQSFFSGFGDFWSGYPAHFVAAWYADVPLLLAAILIAFKVKETRARRRYFTLVTTLTIVVLASFLASTLPGIGKNL